MLCHIPSTSSRQYRANVFLIASDPLHLWSDGGGGRAPQVFFVQHLWDTEDVSAVLQTNHPTIQRISSHNITVLSRSITAGYDTRLCTEAQRPLLRARVRKTPRGGRARRCPGGQRRALSSRSSDDGPQARERPLAPQSLSGNVSSAGLSVPDAVPDLSGREQGVLLPGSEIQAGVEDGRPVSRHPFTLRSAQPGRPLHPLLIHSRISAVPCDAPRRPKSPVPAARAERWLLEGGFVFSPLKSRQNLDHSAGRETWVSSPQDVSSQRCLDRAHRQANRAAEKA